MENTGFVQIQNVLRLFETHQDAVNFLQKAEHELRELIQHSTFSESDDTRTKYILNLKSEPFNWNRNSEFLSLFGDFIGEETSIEGISCLDFVEQIMNGKLCKVEFSFLDTYFTIDSYRIRSLDVREILWNPVIIDDCRMVFENEQGMKHCVYHSDLLRRIDHYYFDLEGQLDTNLKTFILGSVRIKSPNKLWLHWLRHYVHDWIKPYFEDMVTWPADNLYILVSTLNRVSDQDLINEKDFLMNQLDKYDLPIRDPNILIDIEHEALQELHRRAEAYEMILLLNSGKIHQNDSPRVTLWRNDKKPVRIFNKFENTDIEIGEIV